MIEDYLFKASLSLLVLYVFYKLLLRYEFNHQLNRIIGVTCVLFSAVLPFIQLNQLRTSGYLPATLQIVAEETSDFHNSVSSVVSHEAVNAFTLVYVMGAGFFLIRSLVGLTILCRLYFNSPKRRQWGFTVVTLDKSVSPFTFFHMLFVGKNSMDEQEMQTMLVHERVHRDQYHSIDTLILEVLRIVYWFNPVMVFFQRDIKAQHEYLADQHVLQTGIDPVVYQLTLFKAQTGLSLELGNYLSNKTSLTKRINMMRKERSKSKVSYARVGLFIALMSVLLFVGAYSDRNAQVQGDKMATYEEGQEALYTAIKKRIMYPAAARKENSSGLVEVSFTVNEKGDVENVQANATQTGNRLSEVMVVGYSTSDAPAKGIDEVLKAEGVRVVQTLGKFVPAQRNGKPVESVVILPIQFKLN